MKMKNNLSADLRGMALKALLFLSLTFAAFVFGLLAVSGEPVIIALGVGLVGGALLLANPKAAVVIMIVAGLVMGALISFAGSAFSKLPWAMALLGMLLLIPAFLSFFRKRQAPVPGFVWLAVAFLVYAVAATALQGNAIAESVAGFKRYFQVFGLMLALALLAFSDADWKLWKKLLLAIGLLQLPFALYELLVLVPQRGGLNRASFTTDVVAGTFGANLEGGSPGTAMVVFLLIIFGFLFARWRSGLISGTQALLLSIVLFLPIGMGENKVVVLMVPMIWFVLVRHDVVRSPVRYLPVLLAGALATLILGYAYIELIMRSNVEDVVRSTIAYNFADAGYALYYLNRTTVLSFWFSQQGLHDPVGLFFGNGLGSAFVGQVSGHVGVRYPRHGIDLTAASTLLWDLGIVGLTMFAAIFVSAWRTASKIYRETKDSEMKADCLAVQASISLFLTMIIYSQDIVNLISLEIVYSLSLGYLAFLYSKHCAFAKTQAS